MEWNNIAKNVFSIVLIFQSLVQILNIFSSFKFLFSYAETQYLLEYEYILPFFTDSMHFITNIKNIQENGKLVSRLNEAYANLAFECKDWKFSDVQALMNMYSCENFIYF